MGNLAVHWFELRDGTSLIVMRIQFKTMAHNAANSVTLKWGHLMFGSKARDAHFSMCFVTLYMYIRDERVMRGSCHNYGVGRVLQGV